MTQPTTNSPNLSYQTARAVGGGSYTERKLARLELPSLTGKRFLDLGCNMGFYCGVALSGGASRVVGVDIDRAVIEAAKKDLPKVEFFDGGWDKFPDGQFDVTICLSAIHYASDPLHLVRQIHSHLAPDGLFVLEGGIVGVGEKWATDILIPGWRTVGDRCRHLSEAYVRRHLLAGFEWKIVGESELRGGDDVPRYVIHARPKGQLPHIGKKHSIDILEYSRGLSLSSRTIVPAKPSYEYVRALGRLPAITAEAIAPILFDGAAFDTFCDDLIFAIGRTAGSTEFVLQKNLPVVALQQIHQRLKAAGIRSA